MHLSDPSIDIDQKLLQRFEIIQKIRKTNSGVIWKAIDRKTTSLVAIKKLNQSSKPIHLLKAIRETLILQESPKHQNILKVLQVINKSNDFYIVYEFVEMDLISLIKVKILEPVHLQVILYNILCTLYFIHQGDLVHLGLSPAKILVDQECQIKIIGFGFSQAPPILKPKFTTLTYLAPEILLQGKATISSDVWSIGCIFGQMLCQTELFTGTSAITQLEKIVELIGKPDECNVSDISQHILNAITSEKKKSFSSISTDSVAIDLLKRMLTFDPSIRITIPEIVKHPFFSSIYKPGDLRKPLTSFASIEEMNLKSYQEVLKDRAKKLEPTMQSLQQIEELKKKGSLKDLSPNIGRQRSQARLKISPGQSPIMKRDSKDFIGQLKKKGTIIKQ